MVSRNAAAWARVGAIGGAAALWAIGCSSTSSTGPQDAVADADALLDAPATTNAQPGIDAPPDESTAEGSTDGFEEAGPSDAPSEAPAEAAAGDTASESGSVDASHSVSEGAVSQGADATTDAGNVSNEAGGCSFVGTWTGTYSCSTMNGVGFTWAINADGTAIGTISGKGTVDQTWSLTGDTLSITDTGGSSCGSSSVGTYTVAFSASCNQATLTEVDDLCTGRGNCVGGLVCARQ